MYNLSTQFNSQYVRTMNAAITSVPIRRSSDRVSNVLQDLVYWSVYSIVEQTNRCPTVPYVFPCSVRVDGGITGIRVFLAFFGQKKTDPCALIDFNHLVLGYQRTNCATTPIGNIPGTD